MFLTSLVLLFLQIVQISCDSETDRRIVGGRLALSDELPFQVSLRRSFNNQHFCGGTIISSRHILTAAHCCYQSWGGLLPPFMLYVMAGQQSLQLTSSSVTRNVSKLIIHEGYDPNYVDNDLAVLELDQKLPLADDFIEAIALNKAPISGKSPCTVSGWGVLKYGSTLPSQKLLVTEVFTLDRDLCQDRYNLINVTLQEGAICAVNDNKSADACQGDSGGPLICGGRLTGVISTGKGCADRKFPGIYTDVGYFFSWITNRAVLDDQAGQLEKKDESDIWGIFTFLSSGVLKNFRQVGVVWLLLVTCYISFS